MAFIDIPHVKSGQIRNRLPNSSPANAFAGAGVPDSFSLHNGTGQHVPETTLKAGIPRVEV